MKGVEIVMLASRPVGGYLKLTFNYFLYFLAFDVADTMTPYPKGLGSFNSPRQKFGLSPKRWKGVIRSLLGNFS